jgi:hypothetical protein
MTVAEQHVPMKGEATSKSRGLGHRLPEFVVPWRRVILYVTLSLGFFLLGFVPMWFKVNDAVEQRDAAQRQVLLTQLENRLGTAMVDVQRGEYEPARQTTSDFYTDLRRQIDAGASVFTPAQREKLRPLLGERDELITLLARSDPAAADRLYLVYSSYNKLTSNGG